MRSTPLLLLVLGMPLAACSQGGDGAMCQGGKCDDLGEFPDGAQFDRFRGFKEHVGGIPGLLPAEDELPDVFKGMNESEERGFAAWHLFGGEGGFLREISRSSKGYVNLLETIDSRKRNDRWETYGVLNDPGCRPSTKVDRFGLVLDDCDDPYSTGIVGLRLKPNPEFDTKAWDAIGGAAGHLGDPEKTFSVGGAKLHGWEVEPPYLPSLACTVCHAAPNPLKPPVDIDNPRWDEIVFTIGNQYFKEGVFLGARVPTDDFSRELLFSQPPGTSDTSRVATDHLFNPNTVNGVTNLRHRPIFKEAASSSFNPDKMSCDGPFPKNVGELLDGLNKGQDPRTPNGQCVPAMRVLKDGADSSGPTGAVLRVFLNVGACNDMMVAASGDFLHGVEGQEPISRKALSEQCGEYQLLESLVLDSLNFLAFSEPYKLADAEGVASCRTPDGRPCLTTDTAVLDRGAVVYAENCATCHASSQPDDPAFREDDPATWFTPARNAFFREWVTGPDLDADYLADDRRYSISVIGTNVARSFGTNALEGHVWSEFSSQTYKDLPAVGSLNILIPFTDIDISMPLTAPAGGRGYLRPASLVNLWTSAPFLHNNGLGTYNGKFDIDGRIAAFENAARKLLFPAERLGRGTIRRTSRLTFLDTGSALFGIKIKLPLPAGTPIDFFANLGAALGRGKVSADDILGTPSQIFENVKEHMAGTDPIQDKGHFFGAGLAEADKQALIEFMKTL